MKKSDTSDYCWLTIGFLLIMFGIARALLALAMSGMDGKSQAASGYMEGAGYGIVGVILFILAAWYLMKKSG